MEDIEVWKAYRNASGHSVIGIKAKLTITPQENKILSNMQAGNRVALNINIGENVGHSVVMQRIVQQTKTKINGAVTSKLLYYIMNPANGGYIQKLTQQQIINAYNIFFIRP